MLTFLLVLFIVAAVSAGFYWREKRWAVAIAATVSACAIAAIWQDWTATPSSYVAGPTAPGEISFTAEEMALPELDEEEVTRKIKDLPLADGWRLLPVVQHRYPPHKSRRTVLEEQYDPREGNLLIPLDLSLLEGGTLKVRRKTNVVDLGDIFIRHPPYYEAEEDWQRLGYPGPECRELQLSRESLSAWFEPGELASSTTSPALIEVIVEPRSDLRSIWVKTEKKLPPTSDLVTWSVLPGKIAGYRPLKKVSLLVQAYDPGEEGKPLSANFLQQLQAAAVPLVLVTGHKPEKLASDGSFRLEYDPSLLTDEKLEVGIVPSTGTVTCVWRVCVRCDWYTNQ